MADEKEKRPQQKPESANEGRVPDSRQNNGDINKGGAWGELNESKLPDFQFTPPPKKTSNNDE